MKLNINIPATPKRTRILAAFMAFLIFALTFQEAFVGWEVGTKVKAASNVYGPDIYSNTDFTSINALKSNNSPSSDGYQYTGNIKPSKVAVFDYVSDDESKTGNSYNNYTHNIPSGGYDDAFTGFNKAISNTTSNNDASSNITIKFQIKGTTEFVGYQSVLIGFYKNKSSTSGEPDAGWYPMKLDMIGSDFTNQYTQDRYIQFTYTENYSSIKSALGVGSNHIQHIKIKVTKNNVKSGSNWGRTFTVGLNYWIGHNSNTFVGKTTYIWADQSRFVTDGTQSFAPTGSSTSGDAENTYSCQFIAPLYFGCFYHGFDPDSDYSTNNNEDRSGYYTTSNHPDYNNFYWNANMGLKAESENAVSTTAINQGKASVQKLVDATLTSGNLTQNGVQLPYFSTSSTYGANAAKYSPYIKYYDKDNKNEPISFPFYEVVKSATSSDVAKKNNMSALSGEYARFYQFNAKDANLIFNIDDAANHKGHYSESTTQKTSNLGNVGFFPFTNNNKSNNNLGFGTMFEMQFRLQGDGCVGVTDANGVDQKSNNATRINTVFEFSGDDDLWVFIDDKLVLDMGGTHSESTGKIDFYKREITVDRAVQRQTTIANPDVVTTRASNNLSTLATETKITNSTTVTFNSLFTNDSFTDETKATYSGKVHTMKIFYMERGMNDSNLLIRFNYAMMANFSKMKIQEITDFSTVNNGLLEVTKKAADSDVFEYTVENKGTKLEDVKESSAKYPTRENHTRTNPGDSNISTQLTPNGPSSPASQSYTYVPPGTGTIAGNNRVDNTSDWGYVSNTSYIWIDGFGDMYLKGQRGAGKTTGSNYADSGGGKLYLTYGMETTAPGDSERSFVESSAEFEKQFTEKTSYMRITQGNKIFSHGIAGEEGDEYNVFNNRNIRSSSSDTDFEDYYTLTKVELMTYGQENYTDFTNTYNSDGNDAKVFQFANIPAYADNSVMMTEYFTNTVNVGAIQVTKSLSPNDTVQDEFEFQIQFTNVFGVPDVNVLDYSSVKYSKGGVDNLTLSSDGKFYLKKGETVTITGIPVGTHYVISETSPSTNYQFKEVSSGSLTGDKTTTTQTATVVNTRRLGTLTLNKAVTGGAPAGSFTFTGTLTGPEGVNLSQYSISGTNVTLGTYDSEHNSYTFTASVTAGTPVVINNIPYGTTYTVNESGVTGTTSRTVSVNNGTASDYPSSGNAATGTINNSNAAHTVTITNNYPSATPVTVKKTGGSNLNGAELELWYKETTLPKTNSFNTPKTVPSQQVNGMKVTESSDNAGIPGPAVSSSTATTYTYETTYADPPVPSSSDTEWILPRNDTDYIYFRDYNVGQYTADKDSISFAGTEQNTDMGKRSWRQTYFKNKGGDTHHQVQELGFTDNDSLWYAAEFYGDGKKTVKYAMWERFVDKFTYTERYTDANADTSHTVNTVVWKIQPPDGYTQVRFILLSGDNWIRSTEKFTFKLGEIYHKTNWGGSYSSAHGGSYYDVPVNDESHAIWAPSVKSATGSVSDQRNTALDQARKYEPTEQKVIFHCNSAKVWHNIHIMFFDESGNSVNGQTFPGYMMEPYAYAHSNYRMDDGYLTYELTIPANAKYFQVNNGVESGPYAFKTEKKELYTASNLGTVGTKNYGNYFCLGAYETDDSNTTTDNEKYTSGDNNGLYKLYDWSETVDTKSATYTTANVESDYDYIYFKKPSGWSNHVYAYFYGGGNLRDDNWQRACYSAWPGVAAAGTEYVENTDGTSAGTATYHSNTYTYTTTGDTYNGTNKDSANNKDAGTAYLTSPETTVNGGTIYKFRIPKGDRTNYSKVVFNDGLKDMGGGNESVVIPYNSGHLYDQYGNSQKHYEKETNNYTGSGEYIYIKNTANWDDLHITFYNDNGTQILQSGVGYIMDYAGKVGSTQYFRIPVPSGAKKFSVNNGLGKTTQVTSKYDITRLDGNANPASSGTNDYVYELKIDKSLTRLGIENTKVTHNHTNVTAQTEDTSNYVNTNGNASDNNIHTTGGTNDTLCICDTAGWDAAIGNISVTFYQSSGAFAGGGVMIVSNTDSDGNVWYTKLIPEGAASFSVTYSKNSGANVYNTSTYPIYSTSTSATNYTTSGDMFYKTEGTNVLTMTDAESTATPPANDETYAKRGDYLYFESDSEYTSASPLTVTFYGAGDTVIKSGVTAKYINDNGETGAAERYWYKVSIPTGAEKFSIGSSSTKADIYELKAAYSPYEKDYTLGDMQYAISGGTLNTTPLYPVFTEDAEYTATMGGKEISTRGTLPAVDESKVEGYAGASVGTTPAVGSGHTPSDTPVLYNTAKDNVKYTWTEGSPADDLLRFEKPSGWSTTITAEFYNGTGTSPVTSVTMTSGSPYSVTVPDTTQYTYDKVLFKDSGSNKTTKIDLLGDHGKNYICEQTTNNSYSAGSGKVGFDNTEIGWGTVYAHFWGNSSTETEWPGTQMTNNNGIWTVNVPAGSTHVIFNNGSDKSKTLNLTLSGNVGKVFHPRVSDKLMVKCGDVNTQYGDGNAGERYAHYWTGSDTDTKTGNSWDKQYNGLTGDSKYGDTYTVPSDNYGNVKVYRGTNTSNYTWCSYALTLNADNNYGRGQVYKLTVASNNRANWEYLGIGNPDYEDSGYWNSSVTTWTLTPNSSSGGQTTYTYTYQPEDRYGMISAQNSTTPVTYGTGDVNDYIKIVGASDLYIKFFDSFAGAGTELGTSSPSNAKGMKIAYTAMINIATDTAYTDTPQPGTGADAANAYMVRIPKGAKSFTITNGDGTRTGTYNLVVNSLTTPSTIEVYTSDGQLTGTGDKVTLTEFYHAGSTFTVADSSTAGALDITLSDVRDGYTVGKSAMADPLTPRTDADYIFFTDDASNTMGGASTKTVYAYFYGDADGEYCAWPGIKASTDNSGAADTTYTDNDGKTVYRFRIPKQADGEGKYKYVIFTDGKQSGRQITQAVEYAAGMNYILGTTPTQAYGETTTAAIPLTAPAAKANNASTAPYSVGSTNNYIYIANNGTQNITTSSVGTGKFQLDEMHVTFYDSNMAVIGTSSPGYIPDKVIGSGQTYSPDNGTTNYDVYKIQVPDNAKYFQINNGINKGSNADTKIRYSEIKELLPSGLYKFVDNGSEAADYVEGSNVASSQADRRYLLDLVNPVIVEEGFVAEPTTTDVHLATVVTAADGTVDHIKWLKDELNDIDSNYLANTDGSGTVVKVVKQGEYYWKEVVPPGGYSVNPTPTTFTIPGYNPAEPPEIDDDEIETTTLTLKKVLKTVKSSGTNSGEGTTGNIPETFTFDVTVTAPLGFTWTSSNQPTYKVGTGSATAVANYSYSGLTCEFKVTAPANGTNVVISGIPEGSYYYVEEESHTGYMSEPVLIQKGTSDPETVTEISGDDVPQTYTVTNKREVGSLSLAKNATGDFAEAGVTTSTSFPLIVTLTAPANVDLRDYLSYATLTDADGLNATVKKINGTAVSSDIENTYNTTNPVTSLEIEVSVLANNGTKSIVNLPVGTMYTVKEGTIARSGGDETNGTWECTNTTGEVEAGENETDEHKNSRTIGSTSPSQMNPTVTIGNEYSYTPPHIPDPGSLQISKTVNGVIPTAMGSDPVYAFYVTFDDVDVPRDNITVSGGILEVTYGDAPETLFPTGDLIIGGTTILVKFQASQTVTISNIPYNTQYNVTEDTAHYYVDSNGDGDYLDTNDKKTHPNIHITASETTTVRNC